MVGRNENVGSFEPLLVSESSKHRTKLTDLAIDLASKSAGLRRCLTSGIVEALSGLVRSMNCY